MNQKLPEEFADQCVRTPEYCASLSTGGVADPQCLCAQRANALRARLQLPGSAGGYTLFIVNAGANNQPVNIKLEVPSSRGGGRKGEREREEEGVLD